MSEKANSTSIDRGHDRWVTVGGHRIHVVERGERRGSPLLLLPGGLSHARWWDFTAPLLAEDRQVFALDPLGHGDSDWLDPPTYSIEGQLEDIARACTLLSEGPWYVGGQSHGGLLSASLAARGASWIRAIVLVDIPFEPTNPRLMRVGRRFRVTEQPRFETHEDALRSFRMFPDKHLAPPEVVEHLARESVRKNDDGSYTTKFDWAFFRPTRPKRGAVFTRFQDVLERIGCPALCVRGAESTILTAEQLERIASLMPRVETAEIADATHHPHVENPGALAAVMKRFLMGQDRG